MATEKIALSFGANHTPLDIEKVQGYMKLALEQGKYTLARQILEDTIVQVRDYRKDKGVTEES